MYFKNHFAYLLPERGSSPYIASGYTNGQKVAPLKIRLIDDRDHMLFPFYNKTKANCFLINHGNRLYTNGASVIRMIKKKLLKGTGSRLSACSFIKMLFFCRDMLYRLCKQYHHVIMFSKNQSAHFPGSHLHLINLNICT